MKDNLHVLEPTGFCPDNAAIAAYLRTMAEGFDVPTAAGVESLTFIVEYSDGYIDTGSCGKPTDLARMVGLLTLATNQLMNARPRAVDDEE